MTAITLNPSNANTFTKHKWFSFCFNGQLANYASLRARLLREGEHHLARDTDTEIIMHELGRELSSGAPGRDIAEVFAKVASQFDEPYSLAFLNARGEMLLARDPLGIKPMCYALEGPLFAAASESVALLNLGFEPDSIRSLLPGHLIVVRPDGVKVSQFAKSERTAHCFFEWIYFANVASTLDDVASIVANALGEELARIERAMAGFPLIAIRLWFQFQIRAKRQRTRWHSSWACPVAKVLFATI